MAIPAVAPAESPDPEPLSPFLLPLFASPGRLPLGGDDGIVAVVEVEEGDDTSLISEARYTIWKSGALILKLWYSLSPSVPGIARGVYAGLSPLHVPTRKVVVGWNCTHVWRPAGSKMA